MLPIHSASCTPPSSAPSPSDAPSRSTTSSALGSPGPPNLTYTRHLGRQHGLQLGGWVHEPAVVVPRGAGVQAQRPGLQVELRERQGQNLGLRPPAVRMGDGDGRPEILRQVLADCLVLMILEEA